jgi:hypothetical protein
MCSFTMRIFTTSVQIGVFASATIPGAATHKITKSPQES